MKFNVSKITAITVNYNTPKLLVTSIGSIMRHYPGLNFVVVNLSTDGRKFAFTKTKIHEINQNIGHGPGMDFALQKVKTPLAVCFDTDIIMLKPCLEHMVEKMTYHTYGIGQIVHVDKGGYNVTKAGTPYLHPHFMVLNVKHYLAYEKFVHHGAPCLRTMQHMEREGQSHRLKNFPVKQFVYHKGRGTRRLNPKEFNKNWQ